MTSHYNEILIHHDPDDGDEDEDHHIGLNLNETTHLLTNSSVHRMEGASPNKSSENGMGAVFGSIRETSSLRRFSLQDTSPPLNKLIQSGSYSSNPPVGTSSTFLAGWNVFNLTEGVGILGIPYAIMLGGVPALVMLVLVAAITCHTGKLLVQCLYDREASAAPVFEEDDSKRMRRRRIANSYPAIADRVFPTWGGHFVTSISLVEMFGAVVLYAILMTRMSVTIAEQVLPAQYHLSMHVWTLITTYCTLPLILFTSFKIISWFSMVAVISLLGIILLVLGFCVAQFCRFLQEAPQAVSDTIFYGNATNATAPLFSVSSYSGLPISLGIIVFSYCAHLVFPSVEASMKHPKRFNYMLNVAFSLAAFLKLVFGGFAVALFGSETAQEITSNLYISPVFRVIVSVLVFVNVFFSIPLLAFIINERIDCLLLPRMGFTESSHRHSKFWYHSWILVSRAAVLNGVMLTAMLVPQFALLMGFIGSFTGSLLCFILPCYFHLRLWPSQGYSEKIVSQLILLFGIAACVVGVYYSGRDLARAYHL